MKGVFFFRIEYKFAEVDVVYIKCQPLSPIISNALCLLSMYEYKYESTNNL